MMSVPLSKFMGQTDVVIDRIRTFMRRAYGRPQFMGDIASEIGWSLERTEQFIRKMSDVRVATDAEKAFIDAPRDSVMFVLK